MGDCAVEPCAIPIGAAAAGRQTPLALLLRAQAIIGAAANLRGLSRTIYSTL